LNEFDPNTINDILRDFAEVDEDISALFRDADDADATNRQTHLLGANSKSAHELAANPPEKPVHIVEDLIVEGLTLLCGAPKMGKSWMVLDMCASVADGLPFLGRKTLPGGVFYLALEDSFDRVHTRLLKQGHKMSPRFSIATEMRALDTGLIEQLDDWRSRNPDGRLVVIDTLQKIRPTQKGGANAYEADYNIMTPLHNWAKKNHIALVIVHHLRKTGTFDSGDPFERISGSSGLTGAADTSIVLARERNSDDARLLVTGRDVEMANLALHFETARCQWRMVGKDADTYFALRAYMDDPLVDCLRKLLDKNPGGARIGYDALMAEATEFIGYPPATDSRDLAKKLRTLAPQLMEYEGIGLSSNIRLDNGRVRGVHLTRIHAAKSTAIQTTLNTAV